MTPHPTLLALIDRPDDPEVRTHLERCPPCRAQARLCAGLGDVDPDALPGIAHARRAMAEARESASRGGSLSPGAASAVALLPGATVGQYVLEAPLGRGGMGTVYRVRHAQLGSGHALKVLHRTTDDEHARLLREGRAQSRLRHPNLVAVTDVVSVDGSPGLIIELVDGPSLQAWLREHGRPDLATVDRWGSEILRGVAAAHGAGLVHRDLKPANVLLAPTDGVLVAKVGDFGLARLVGPQRPDESPLTRPGTPLGTPAYMAPEQIGDATTADARSDVFSLGAVLYELATGQRTFPGTRSIDVWDAIRTGRFTPVERLAPGLPRRMVDTITRALSVDPARRFASASEMLAAWNATAPPPERGRAAGLAVAGGVAALALLAVGVASWRTDSAEGPPAPLVERRVTALPGDLQVYTLALSADGGTLAWSDSRGVWVQRVDGGAPVPVLEGGSVHSLDFFPGGERLMVGGLLDGRDAIHAVDTDGGNREELSPDPVRVARLSPDGARVAFMDTAGLWVAPLAEPTARVRLRPLAGADSTAELAWSPSGRSVAAVHASATGGGAWLEVTAADGSSTRRLVEDRRLLALGLAPLAWVEPDRLVWSLAEEARTEVWALDDAEDATSAAAARRLHTWTGFSVTRARPSADGARLVQPRFTSRHFASVLDTSGDPAPRRLTADDWPDAPLAWLDATRVVLHSERPAPGLYVQDLSGAPPVRLRDADRPKGDTVLFDGALWSWRPIAWGPEGCTLVLDRLPLDGGPLEQRQTLHLPAGVMHEYLQVRCATDRCLVSEPRGDGVVFRWLLDDGRALGPVVRTQPLTTRSFAWSLDPAGDRLAVLTADPGLLAITPLAGGAGPSFSVDLNFAGAVTWAPGGAGWFVSGLQEADASPYRVASVSPTGETRVLWSSRGWFLHAPVPAPDGRHLFVRTFAFDDDLWIVDGLLNR